MSHTWSKGSTRAWRRVRVAVLARDGYTCRLKIQGVCATHATHVHHTHGKAVTGDDPRYLVAACAPCNLHVGNPTRNPDPQPRPVTKW